MSEISADPGSDRISVLRENRVVPLLSAPARRRAVQPWQGVLLEQHAVSAIEIPEHEHRELCLHLQTSGTEALEWWSEGKHRVEHTAPGSMILLPAGTRDRLRWYGTSERLILSIRSELMDRVAAESGAATAPEFKALWSLNDIPLRAIITDMGRQVREGWPLGRLYADLTATGLASLLLRRHAANPFAGNNIKGGLRTPQLRQAMEFMTENLDRDLSLEEIARQVSLSPFHFAREFRSTTGRTAYQYLLDQRIDRAKHLLKTRDWPVQEIAQMTGLHSAVNFVRAFRQRVGQTPGVWRKSQ